MWLKVAGNGRDRPSKKRTRADRIGREIIDGIVVTSVLGFVFGELDEEAGLLFRLLDGGRQFGGQDPGDGDRAIARGRKAASDR